MTEYHDSAFVADLLLGSGCFSGFQPSIEDFDQGDRGEHIRNLERIVDRLRAQTIHIVAANRHAAQRYDAVDDSQVRRYLRYEAALCRQDLKQHWALYRQAMGELHMLRRAENG